MVEFREICEGIEYLEGISKRAISDNPKLFICALKNDSSNTKTHYLFLRTNGEKPDKDKYYIKKNYDLPNEKSEHLSVCQMILEEGAAKVESYQEKGFPIKLKEARSYTEFKKLEGLLCQAGCEVVPGEGITVGGSFYSVDQAVQEYLNL